MSIDLKTVSDHPVRILDEWLDSLPSGGSGHQERAGGIRAVEVLRAHEITESVTFAALDNDALKEVREAYFEFSQGSSADGTTDGGNGLYLAIDALLGLSD